MLTIIESVAERISSQRKTWPESITTGNASCQQHDDFRLNKYEVLI
jgi:hypothetical protein